MDADCFVPHFHPDVNQVQEFLYANTPGRTRQVPSYTEPEGSQTGTSHQAVCFSTLEANFCCPNQFNIGCNEYTTLIVRGSRGAKYIFFCHECASAKALLIAHLSHCHQIENVYVHTHRLSHNHCHLCGRSTIRKTVCPWPQVVNHKEIVVRWTSGPKTFYDFPQFEGAHQLSNILPQDMPAASYQIPHMYTQSPLPIQPPQQQFPTTQIQGIPQIPRQGIPKPGPPVKRPVSQREMFDPRTLLKYHRFNNRGSVALPSQPPLPVPAKYAPPTNKDPRLIKILPRKESGPEQPQN